MQVKTFIATMGLGAAAGAAAILLIPKNSKAYRAANDAAQMLKAEVSHMASKMNQNH